jgi:hypothetical protein
MTNGPLKETLKELARIELSLKNRIEPKGNSLIEKHLKKLEQARKMLRKSLAANGMDYATIDVLVQDEIDALTAEARETRKSILMSHNDDSADNGTPQALCQTFEDYRAGIREHQKDATGLSAIFAFTGGFKYFESLQQSRCATIDAEAMYGEDLWVIMIGGQCVSLEVTTHGAPDENGESMACYQLMLNPLRGTTEAFIEKDAKDMLDDVTQMLSTMEGAAAPEKLLMRVAFYREQEMVLENMRVLLQRIETESNSEIESMRKAVQKLEAMLGKSTYYMVHNPNRTAESIDGDDAPSFWSEDEGWTDLHEGDVFAFDDVELPEGGVLLPLREATSIHESYVASRTVKH